LCFECHTEVDQGKGTREERRHRWYVAHCRTLPELMRRAYG
jgi:hypothetical protein